MIREVISSLSSTSEIYPLVVDIGAGVPLIPMDPGKVEQVLMNLISIAIKYSRGGGRITLACHHEPAAKQVVVQAGDEGIGIAPVHQSCLFTTFQRVERRETQGVRGTGLGLYRVKSLVEFLGGKVWLDSQLNVSSTFSFSPPVRRKMPVS